MNKPLLQVENLSVTYGPSLAVDNVSLTVERNRTLGVVGESGSGKSTLIWALTRLLPGAAKITAGRVMFDGTDLLSLSDPDLRAKRGRRISYISQDPLSALTPTLTIGRQMVDVLYRESWSNRQKRAHCIEALKWVRLPEPEARMQMYPHELSGGQRQRVSIAMALMLSPDLVLADEPTTALDASLEVEILDLLKRLQTETRCAIIFVTHHLGVVQRLCDDVIVMRGGRVREHGSAAAVLSAPKDDYTKILLRCDPARIDVPTRRLPTAADALTDAICAYGGPSDRIDLGGEPILCVENLSVSFGRSVGLPSWLRAGRRIVAAVRNVDFSIQKGQTLALIGESGSGKTTIVRTVTGLLRPDSGRVTVCGNVIATSAQRELQQARSHMAVMFQDPVGSLSPRMTVGRQILEPLIVNNRFDQASTSKVEQLLATVGLTPDFAERYPHQLSGGQARRVCLARALVLEPDLLIADEPTAGLDVLIQGEVLNLLNAIQERLGIAILLITHNMNVVRHCADRVVVLLRGEIVEAGDCDDVIHRPQHAYTKTLIGAARSEALPHSSFGEKLNNE